MNWLKKISHATGDCFRISAKWAVDNDAEVVHGIVTNSATGKTFSHAWCEKNGLVIDLTIGIDLTNNISTEYYYQSTQAKVEARYSSDKTLIQMLKNKHWGPWH